MKRCPESMVPGRSCASVFRMLACVSFCSMTVISHLYDLRWAVLGVLLAVYVGKKIQAYNRLKAFNGPFISGWSEIWHVFAILSFKSHLKYHEVCKKYGTSDSQPYVL